MAGKKGEERLMNYMWDVAKDGAAAFAAEIEGAEVIEMGDAGRCALVNIRLPIKVKGDDLLKAQEYLKTRLREEYETSIMTLLFRGELWARVSGQIYLAQDDFVKAGKGMAALLARVNIGEWLE